MKKTMREKYSLLTPGGLSDTETSLISDPEEIHTAFTARKGLEEVWKNVIYLDLGLILLSDVLYKSCETIQQVRQIKNKINKVNIQLFPTRI